MTRGPIVLSVVVPAYNEAGRIGRTLWRIGDYLKNEPYDSEIIIVDDGSTDGTEALLRAYAARIENIKLLQFRTNQGKGAAVRAGMLAAQGRYRLFMDADGSTDIRFWRRMYDALEGGADVVVSSRHLPNSHILVRQSLHREILGHLFRFMVRTVSGLTISDTQNGFKAFTAEAAQRIFRRQEVAGWAFDIEALSIAKRLDMQIDEVPITWIDDRDSRMTARAMPRMLADLFAIRAQEIPAPRPTYYGVPRLITLS